MRPEFKVRIKNLLAALWIIRVVTALAISISLIVFSCSNETPLVENQALTLPESTPAAVEKPNFVVVVGDKSQMPRPFLTSPGVCGPVGPSGGTISNGPVTLIIPAGALGEDTDICISAVNQQQLIAEFTPAGQTFGANVSMRWNLYGSSAEGVAENVTTIWFNPVTEEWEDVVTEEPIDTNTTETLIQHFSKYGQVIEG